MQNRLKIIYINIFSFLIALHYAVIVYYGSTFLGRFLGIENVWIIYSLGAFLAICFNLFSNNLLHQYDINKIVPTFSILAAINLLFIFSLQYFNLENIFLISLSFSFYIMFAQGLFTLSSVMLEDLSQNEKTGNLRGVFLSITNLGYLTAPFLAKIVLQGDGSTSFLNQKYLFLVSSFIVFLSFVLYKIFIKNLPTIRQNKKFNWQNFYKNSKKVFNNRDLRIIILAQVFVEVFYSLFVIYAPQKLFPLGVTVSQYLGTIIPIAMLAFMIVPSFLGSFEDKFNNEKKVLMFSLFGLSVIVSMVGFFNFSNLMFWTILIFFTRFFAAAIETSTSSYLFKKINVSETEAITWYGNAQPIAYLLFPPIFGIIFYFTNLTTVFFFVSVLLLSMVLWVSKIGNTYENR